MFRPFRQRCEVFCATKTRHKLVPRLRLGTHCTRGSASPRAGRACKARHSQAEPGNEKTSVFGLRSSVFGLRSSVFSLRSSVFTFQSLATFIFSFCGNSPALANPPELNGFFPSGGQRGQTVEVRAEGKFPVWPVEAWTSSAGIHVAANEKEKSLLRISIAADACPGLHWIRLHDDQGAARLRPFLVGTTREVLETDTDNVPPLDLAAAIIVNGRLAKNDEVDEYRFQLAAGQTLVAALTAHRFLGSPMDAVMQLVDLDNEVVLLQNDDAPGRDPRVVYQADRDGLYAIRLFAFPETPTSRIGFAGGDRFVYRLALTTTGFVDYAFPLTVSATQSGDVRAAGWSLPATAAARVRRDDHQATLTLFHVGRPGWYDVDVSQQDCLQEKTDNSLATPLACELPFVVSGRIDQEDTGDAYRFYARSGDRLRVIVESRQLGFPLDPVIEIYDDETNQLAKQDDSDDRDCSLEFQVPADGHYRVIVRDLHNHGGPSYVYRLTTEWVKPSFALEVAEEVYTTKANDELTIAVKIARHDGFVQNIHVTALGLSAGVLTSSATSITQDASEKEVKLKLMAPLEVRGAFQILGATRSSNRHVLAHTAATVAGHTTSDFWLTVTESVPGN